MLENANKLKRAVLSRETSDLAREQHERAGDWDAERALAKQAEERMRMKHGVVTKTVAGDRDRDDGEGS